MGISIILLNRKERSEELENLTKPERERIHPDIRSGNLAMKAEFRIGQYTPKAENTRGKALRRLYRTNCRIRTEQTPEGSTVYMATRGELLDSSSCSYC